MPKTSNKGTRPKKAVKKEIIEEISESDESDELDAEIANAKKNKIAKKKVIDTVKKAPNKKKTIEKSEELLVSSEEEDEKDNLDAGESDSEDAAKQQKSKKTKVKKEQIVDTDTIDPKRVLEIHTTQTAEFKKAIERVANVITECCITFIAPREAVEGEKKNNGGIRIFKLSSNKSIMIKVNLDASKFEKFYCGEQKITIGLDMPSFHNWLKSISDSDTLMMYMNRDQRSVLYVRSVSESDTGREATDVTINLMDLANTEKELPPTKFDNITIMSAKKFNDICKDLNNNSTRVVEIASVNGDLSFTGSNENGKITRIYSDKEDGPIKKDKNKQKIVQGLYDLKNLMAFSKCGKITETVSIHLKNDFPLILALTVGNLGHMYVFLAPIAGPMDN